MMNLNKFGGIWNWKVTEIETKTKVSSHKDESLLSPENLRILSLYL